MNVAEVLLEGLGRAGTPRIFAASGHPAILVAARARAFPAVEAGGALAACVMAAVTGALTGVPGAALAAGSEADDVAAGLEYARLNRAPMILLTTGHEVRGAITAPVKASIGIEAGSAGHWIAHGARLAMVEPRGPVHLTLPPGMAESAAVPVAASCRPDPVPHPDAAALDAAARLLAGARHPVMLVGLQCRTAEAAAWVRALAEALPAPLLVTARGKGALPDPHPLMLGIFDGGDDPVLGQADLVVALGLDELEIPRGWAPRAPLLLLGATPAFAEHPRVVGTIGVILEELAPRLRDRGRADWDVARLDRWKREAGKSAARSPGALDARRAVEIVREATPPGTLASVEAGALRDPVVRFWWTTAPGQLLVSDDPLPPGVALPAAIAAQLVDGERRAICFVDPRGLEAAAAELTTAARLGLPLVAVVLGQRARVAGCLARAREAGWRGLLADDDATLAASLERALAARSPVLLGGTLRDGG